MTESGCWAATIVILGHPAMRWVDSNLSESILHSCEKLFLEVKES